jgi:cobalt/nickel transport system permease protein
MQKAVRQMFALEELASGSSAVHRLHPTAKLLATVVYLVCVISVDRLNFPALSLFFFYPAVMIALSGIPFGAIVRRVLPALPFVLFVGISNALLEPGVYVSLGGFFLSRGVASLIVLMEKAALSVSAVLILMATTPMAKLLACLRVLKVPRALVTVMMLSVRYLSLLAGEAGRMARAYALRSGEARGIRMRDMGSFVGQLLLRSFDRAERVYAAMKLRGYDGDFPLAGAGRPGAADAVFLLMTCGTSLLFRFFTIDQLIRLWL